LNNSTSAGVKKEIKKHKIKYLSKIKVMKITHVYLTHMHDRFVEELDTMENLLQ